ncbi:MAG: XrtA/PEP-CTERM system histidine kinase PrsK [Hyphomicrobiaceae bacterium]
MESDWYARPAVWSYGIAAIAFAGFAIQLVVSWRGARRAAWLVASIALGALWAALSAGYAAAPDGYLLNAASIIDTARLAAALLFLSLLDRPAGAVEGTTARVLLPDWRLALVVAAFVAMSLYAPTPGPGLPARSGAASLPAFGIALGGAILGLVLTERVYRRTPHHARWGIKPLCLAFAGMFGFDLLLYSDATLFRALDGDLWAARGAAHALVIPLFGMAAARNREWKLEVSVSRGVLAGSTALFVAGLYLLLVSGIGYYVRYFGGTWGKALQAVLIFAALLVLALIALSGTFRSKLRVFIAKNFFAYRYDYREEWLNFTRAFAALGSSQTVQESCVRALAALVESPGGAIWLKNGAGFVQKARLNFPAVEGSEPEDGPVATFLAQGGWVIDIEDAKSGLPAYRELTLPAWLTSTGVAGLVVPLLHGDELIGFVVLSSPRAQIELDWEVTDLLKTAGRQAASYLAQLQSAEALLEARKFDSFNRMSAFVVHDLKNLVAQLQLLLRNADRHIDKPEFRQDMLDTVKHVVERMHQLMLQLRAGATPVDKPRPIDLAALMRKVLMSKRASGQQFELAVEPGVIAIGHEDRLERVIGHLVQNAFDAAPVDPRVEVRVRQEPGCAVVEVKDNGAGMSADFVRNQLFKPFQTTKIMGMGIGAYESQQYVTSLGGRILVDSAPNAGTRVRVELPLSATAEPEAVAERAG